MILRPLTLTIATLLTATPALAARTDGGVHAIVLVDLMPDQQVQGTRVLVDFVHQARQDRAVRSITLVQQASASNHYVIDEAFADQAAYQRFVQAPYVRSFRTALFQHLGSPWDERPGLDVVE